MYWIWENFTSGGVGPNISLIICRKVDTNAISYMWSIQQLNQLLGWNFSPNQYTGDMGPEEVLKYVAVKKKEVYWLPLSKSKEWIAIQNKNKRKKRVQIIR